MLAKFPALSARVFIRGSSYDRGMAVFRPFQHLARSLQKLWHAAKWFDGKFREDPK
jgi:hypothetical protein